MASGSLMTSTVFLDRFSSFPRTTTAIPRYNYLRCLYEFNQFKSVQAHQSRIRMGLRLRMFQSIDRSQAFTRTSQEAKASVMVFLMVLAAMFLSVLIGMVSKLYWIPMIVIVIVHLFLLFYVSRRWRCEQTAPRRVTVLPIDDHRPVIESDKSKRRCKECRQYITARTGKMIRICSMSGHPVNPEDECDREQSCPSKCVVLLGSWVFSRF